MSEPENPKLFDVKRVGTTMLGGSDLTLRHLLVAFAIGGLNAKEHLSPEESAEYVVAQADAILARLAKKGGES